MDKEDTKDKEDEAEKGDKKEDLENENETVTEEDMVKVGNFETLVTNEVGFEPKKVPREGSLEELFEKKLEEGDRRMILGEIIKHSLPSAGIEVEASTRGKNPSMDVVEKVI